MNLGPTAKLVIDRKTFFNHVRADLFGGFLSASQVIGLSNILAEAECRLPGDPRHLAYRLATVFHETDKAMIPVREAGGEAYLKAKPYYPWVGMGLVQVTWEKNGRKFGATKPEDLMSWPVALRALFDGMDEGVFTGLGLQHFFDAHTDDPIGARRIINGLDRASLVAGYHAKFLAAIKAASTSPTPELDLIRGAVAKAAAEQAKPVQPIDARGRTTAQVGAEIREAQRLVDATPKVAPPSPVSGDYLPTKHVDNAKAPSLAGWRAVVASVRTRLGMGA